MTHDRDPFDILKENDPAFRIPLPDGDSPKADELLERIMSHGDRSRRSRRRRRVLAVAAVVALLLLMTAAATWYGRSDDVSSIDVACFAEVSVGSDIFGTVAAGSPDASVCEEPWEEGILTNPEVEPGEVPPLTACISDVGSYWVFPTDDRGACERLGLAVPNPNQSTGEFDDLGAAREDIFSYLDAAPCQPLEEAEARLRSILDEHGLTDWAIRRQPDHPDRPCASVAYDVPTKTVTLVPIPHAP